MYTYRVALDVSLKLVPAHPKSGPDYAVARQIDQQIISTVWCSLEISTVFLATPSKTTLDAMLPPTYSMHNAIAKQDLQERQNNYLNIKGE